MPGAEGARVSRGEATRSEGLGKAGTEECLLSEGTAARGLMRPHVPAEPSAGSFLWLIGVAAVWLVC